MGIPAFRTYLTVCAVMWALLDAAECQEREAAASPTAAAFPARDDLHRSVTIPPGGLNPTRASISHLNDQQTSGVATPSLTIKATSVSATASPPAQEELRVSPIDQSQDSSKTSQSSISEIGLSVTSETSVGSSQTSGLVHISSSISTSASAVGEWEQSELGAPGTGSEESSAGSTVTGIIPSSHMVGPPDITASSTMIESPDITVSSAMIESPDITASSTMIESPAVTASSTMIESPAVTASTTMIESLDIIESPDIPASSTMIESPDITASSSTIESPDISASSTMIESRDITASSTMIESPDITASSTMIESPDITASSTMIESPDITASSTMIESPDITASSTMIESPDITASSTMIESSDTTASSTMIESPDTTASSTMIKSPNITASSTMIESPDITVSSTMIESPDITASSTMIESLDITASSTMIESPDITASSTMIESPDIIPSSTMIESPDITASPTMIVSPDITASSTIIESPDITTSSTMIESPDITTSSTMSESPDITASSTMIESQSFTANSTPGPTITSLSSLIPDLETGSVVPAPTISPSSAISESLSSTYESESSTFATESTVVTSTGTVFSSAEHSSSSMISVDIIWPSVAVSATITETATLTFSLGMSSSSTIQPTSSAFQPPPSSTPSVPEKPTEGPTTNITAAIPELPDSGQSGLTNRTTVLPTTSTTLTNSTTSTKPTKPGLPNEIDDLKPAKDKTTIKKPLFEHTTRKLPTPPTEIITPKSFTTKRTVTYGPLPQPTLNNNEIHPTDKNAGGVATPKPTPWTPPTYIAIELQMTWSEFCVKMREFQNALAEKLEEASGKPTVYSQIRLQNEQYCKTHYLGHWRVRKRGGVIRINVYVVDSNDVYSADLTYKLGTHMEEHGGLLSLDKTFFKDKVLSIELHDNRTELPTGVQERHKGGLAIGVLVAIVIVVLIATALMSLLALQLMIWHKRRNIKKMRHSIGAGTRYSVDTHSLSEAIQLSAVSNKYAYINPALVTEDKDYSSNQLDFTGLCELAYDAEVLEDEFLMLPNPMPNLADVPHGAEDKNRYANVIPIPHSRVRLRVDSDDVEASSDYINANFVRGYLDMPKCYIATQAPLEGTRVDFWRMVWEQRSQVIIMLTGLEEHGLPKCSEYFPNTDGGDTVRVYGHCEIIQEKREVRPEWILSTLTIKHLQERRNMTVHHFWLTSWPIIGLPDVRTVIKFLIEIRKYMEDSCGPTVLHCSPGTGRTGTLIAIDIETLSYDDCRTVDVLHCVNTLRQDRPGAVQTKEQYSFIYKVVLEYARMQQRSSPRSSVVSGRSSLASSTLN